MSDQTSREIVKNCLTFNNPQRMPRDIWYLPCFANKYPTQLKSLLEKFPSDIGGVPNVYRGSEKVNGDAYVLGEYIDEWGCEFTNIHEGIIGEVKKPLMDEITDIEKITPPYETLPENYEKAKDAVNRAYGESDKFIMAGCCPRPWERFQFIRGTENAMMDLALYPDEIEAALKKVHDFYMKELEFWTSTDVDAIFFMDDWGAQKDLLISCDMWKHFFKPFYKDYCDIAKANGKHAFMHSDGNITRIYNELIEVGVDAVNSQIFCMNMEEVAETAKGKITFWGEIDRQHVVSAKDTQAGRNAVRKVAKNLYDPKGGIIAQFELGPGANPEMPFAIMDEWEKVQSEVK
ncbi:MAG: methyltransferase [bacterium]|nr:methyltransferase [bacterium]